MYINIFLKYAAFPLIMEENINYLRKWLDITDQQFDILKAIHELEREKLVTNPTKIREVYEKHSRKIIQQCNLSGVLKRLTAENIIKKNNGAKYFVNFREIKSRLELKNKEFHKEKGILQDVIENTDKFICKELETNDVFMKAISIPELYRRLSKILVTAKEYYNISRFPGICLMHPISQAINRSEYGGLLLDRCLRKGDLKVSYITYFEVNRLLEFALEVYKKADIAFNESKLMINQLENQILNSKNLKIYYTKKRITWDIVMPIIDYPNEFFITLRDDQFRRVLGLQVISLESASKVKDIIQKHIEDSILLDENNCKEILNRVRDNLKASYKEFLKNPAEFKKSFDIKEYQVISR